MENSQHRFTRIIGISIKNKVKINIANHFFKGYNKNNKQAEPELKGDVFMKKLKCLAVVMALLLTSGAAVSMPAMATETSNLVENGDFASGLDAWSARAAMNMKVNADEQAELEDKTVGGELMQIVSVDPLSTYKLSFRMKNSVANVAVLSKSIYTVDGVSASAENDTDFAFTSSASDCYDSLAFGEETENPAWKDYETMITVPSRDVNGLRIILSFSADPAFAIDNICLEKVSDRYGCVVNGSFDAGFGEGAGEWSLSNFTAKIDEDGNRYVQSNGTVNGFVDQLVWVESGTTVRFTFKMKNSVDKAAVFHHEFFKSNELNARREGVKNRLSSYPFVFGSAPEEGKTAEWRTYTMDIPVPVLEKKEPVQVRFRLKANKADTELAIDDVSVSYSKDYVEYVMNSDFEMAIPEKANEQWNGWRTFASADVTREVDASGNHFVKINSKAVSNQCIRTEVSLMPGRYILSFKVKKTAETTNPFKIALTHADVTLEGTGNDGYLNGGLEKKDGIAIPVSAVDAWETKTIYFSVGATMNNTHILLPPNGAAAGTYYLDDFSITEDKNSFGFTETVSGGKYSDDAVFQLESGSEDAVVSISDAVTKGRSSIPVTWHYVPETTGKTEKLSLVAAVYEKDSDGRKRLISVSIVEKDTDVSAEAKNGANGLGVTTLYASVPVPDDASTAHTVEVMRWRGISGMTPYADKAVLYYE